MCANAIRRYPMVVIVGDKLVDPRKTILTIDANSIHSSKPRMHGRYPSCTKLSFAAPPFNRNELGPRKSRCCFSLVLFHTTETGFAASYNLCVCCKSYQPHILMNPLEGR